jgi:hypothetical protein
MRDNALWRKCGTFAPIVASLWLSAAHAQTHVVEVLADKYSRYRLQESTRRRLP